MDGATLESLRLPGSTWLIDLDGVVWLAQEPIPGGAEAVGRLRAVGILPLFATNNASPTVDELIKRLGRAGIAAQSSEIATSAQAAALLIQPGARAFVCGDGGIVEALEERGIAVVDEGPVDAVVVGWTRRFDFELLAKSATLVRQGATLIGTNEDATHPTPTGLLPGSGALLAAVATASEQRPEIGGKPYRPMVDLVRSRAKAIRFVVGDRPATDGALARALDVPFGRVESEVAAADGAGADGVAPVIRAADLLGLVDAVLRG